MMFRILGCLAAAASVFHGTAHELVCGAWERAVLGSAPVDSPLHRKYAPDRAVDIRHIRIDVTPNFKERSVAGETKLWFKPIRAGISEVKLNAQDLRVESVAVTGGSAAIKAFQNTGVELIITFKADLPAGEEQEVAVKHAAHPRKGMYFRTAEMGYLPEDEHLFTQGEDIEARHWFPCFDSPNEKFTSEVICRVPEAMTVLSNGRLISEEAAGNGMKAVRWLQDKPHVSYLISLVAGFFKKIEDRYKDIPLAFYTPVSQIDLAPSSFRRTKEMMAFFEEETGVPYPWAKYDQVCVQDFMWGGMENTSQTTLTDLTLFPAETENIRSSQGLVAHELAHQWFGDLVTCQDWSDAWLNEGFATYCEMLFELHADGRDEFHYGLRGAALAFIGKTVAEDSRPIVFRKYDAPVELFGYLIYPKGAWVLHMLRAELGPELFRQCIKTYLERHQFGNVVTHDLIAAVEDVSGRPFDQFFDQWVFHPHHPELEVKYSWSEQDGLARVIVRQVQPLTNEVALFKFPLKVRFKGAFGTVEKKWTVAAKEEEFLIFLESAPETVRVDPDFELLAKMSVDLPREMWVKLLKEEGDMLGRILALGHLAKSRDGETVRLIAERLKNDPFYGVRIEAAQALRGMQTPEALAALIENAAQSDARVRQRVVMAVGGFFDETARDFAKQSLAAEKNPDIRHHALKALGAYPGAEFGALISAGIASQSFRNIEAEGAVQAARERNDPALAGALRKAVEANPKSFTSQGLASALEAVAYLLRDESEKGPVYEFLAGYLASSADKVRAGAIRALGILRDERALGPLGRFAGGPKDAPETAPASRAMETIRANRPVVQELGDLRNEVIELRKKQDDARKVIDELTRRFEAKSAAETSGSEGL